MKLDETGDSKSMSMCFFGADVRVCGGSIVCIWRHAHVHPAFRVYGKLGGISTTSHLSEEKTAEFSLLFL